MVGRCLEVFCNCNCKHCVQDNAPYLYAKDGLARHCKDHENDCHYGCDRVRY